MRGRSQLTHGEVIAVLVANRLCAPSLLYDIAGWASSAAVTELLGVPAMLLNDDRLARALEALAPVAEEVRGQLMVNTVRELPPLVDASRLHLDLTAVRFQGAYEGSALVKKGWSADRTIARQTKTLQASTKAGVAVYFRAHQGSSSELAAFVAAIETLAEALPRGLVVVADSGLGCLENLCAVNTKHVGFVDASSRRYQLGGADDADAGSLAAAHGVVGGRPGDAEMDRCLLDGHGEPLWWALLDGWPDPPALQVKLVPRGNGDGPAGCIGVGVPPVQLGDRDASDGHGASKLGKVAVGLVGYDLSLMRQTAERRIPSSPGRAPAP